MKLEFSRGAAATRLALTAALAAAACVIAGGTVASVKISAVYGAGGNSNALINADFIELYNAGGSDVDMSGYTLQYGSGTGTTMVAAAAFTFPANTTIVAGRYILVQASTNGTVGTANPVTPDISATNMNLGGTAGRVMLFSGVPGTTSSLHADASLDPAFVDYVGYGSAATSFEGTGPATLGTLGAQANNRLTYRRGAGATDTNDNAADFEPGSLEDVSFLPAFREGDFFRNAAWEPDTTPASATITWSMYQ